MQSSHSSYTVRHMILSLAREMGPPHDSCVNLIISKKHTSGCLKLAIYVVHLHLPRRRPFLKARTKNEQFNSNTTTRLDLPTRSIYSLHPGRSSSKRSSNVNVPTIFLPLFAESDQSVEESVESSPLRTVYVCTVPVPGTRLLP